MTDELPILKGILKGDVKYHNAPVRFGRVPKREKARILAAMQQSSNSRSHEKAVAAELEDEQRLLVTVIRAHLDTCEFTREKVQPMLARAREHPSYTACPPTLACPLNPSPQPLTGQQELLQDFSKRFSPVIRGVVEFAKRIPGFALLPQDDQVTLLKAGVFEVLLVWLACMFDSQTNAMICLNGQVLKRESIHTSSNARFLMDSMFDFAERLNALGLNDAELGLFCSVVVIAPDRPGLRNIELIERMQSKLKCALQMMLTQNHQGQPQICHELMKKIPDLRTLNTLHSEKLLAFKMTEKQHQQQQQQQQHWTMEDESKSPTSGASWSSGSDAMDDVKSPLGSVSSTESMCSGEVASLTVEYPSHASVSTASIVGSALHPSYATSHQSSGTPLLAATLAGGVCPHRRRANSGSTSSEEDLLGLSVLSHQGLSITPVPAPSASMNVNKPGRYPVASVASSTPASRKLDSPSDSGIESGTEKLDKMMTSSAPTSVCSSPRSSLEDKDEDMPVLKRVLQAPPLYDTNSLMDEAYKPHKKFRALRNKDSAEAEPMIAPVQPAPPPAPPSQLHLHLTAPAASAGSSTPVSASTMGSLLSSTHSTLAKSLMEGPRMTAEQRKRTDIIHNFIMRGEASGTTSPVVMSPLSAGASTTTGPYSAPPPPTAQYIPNASAPSQQWSMHHRSVIRTAASPSPPAPTVASEPQRIFFSPPASPSSTAPAPQAVATPSSVSPSGEHVVQLQVDIADSQQPLNLSKKSPCPSPRPLPPALEV